MQPSKLNQLIVSEKLNIGIRAAILTLVLLSSLNTNWLLGDL